jgi:hypothetical protein
MVSGVSEKPDVSGQRGEAPVTTLTSQQGTSCRSSVQVYPDTALGNKAKALGCQEDMSGQEGT